MAELAVLHSLSDLDPRSPEDLLRKVRNYTENGKDLMTEMEPWADTRNGGLAIIQWFADLRKAATSRGMKEHWKDARAAGDRPGGRLMKCVNCGHPCVVRAGVDGHRLIRALNEIRACTVDGCGCRVYRARDPSMMEGARR